ncbi:purine-cytosine permease family protein [Saccharopolyspora sp. NPDC002376]
MSQKSGDGQITLAVERHGIEHVETSRRYGKASSQFTARFAPVIYLAGIFVGATGGQAGLGLTGSITAIIAANLLGSIGTGLCASMGPKLGMPQLPMGRAAFGYIGNYLPAVLSLLVYVGYYSVGTVLGAESLAKLFGLPYTPMVVVVAGLSILIGIYGYRMLHSFGKWITRISIVVLAAVSIVMISRGVGPGATSTLSGAEYATAWLLQFTVVFGYTVSWAPYASDYSRYLPESTSSRSIFAWAASGLFAATTWMMILGSVLITVNPSGDVIDAFGFVLPDWLVFVVLLTLGLSAIPHNSVNLYSGAMATLTCEFKVRQAVTVVAAGVIGGLIALAIGGEKFEDSLKLFLHLMSYYITPWLAVLLVNYFKVYRNGEGYPHISAFYDRNGAFGRVNLAGIGALVIGVAVSVPFIGTEVFSGPIADLLGGADLSYFVSGIVAGAIYSAFEKPVNDLLSGMAEPSKKKSPKETS